MPAAVVTLSGSVDVCRLFYDQANISGLHNHVRYAVAAAVPCGRRTHADVVNGARCSRVARSIGIIASVVDAARVGARPRGVVSAEQPRAAAG